MTTPDAKDSRWLDAAVRLATPLLGTTGAEPAVGALVVDPGRQMLFGRAVTPPHGAAQAELLAIADAHGLTQGRTLYTTLEPAAHYTSHAPSTASIAAAGIGRVVVGTLDPVRGGEGLAELAAAGIETVHLPHPPSDVLNEGYVMRLAQGRPFVTLKITLTLQGMVGHARRGSPSLLGVEARRWLERERAASDAVMSGAARAEIEDNDLRVHLAGLDDRAAPRVILAGSRDLELDVELFRAVSGIPIMVMAATDRPLELRPGVEIVAVEGRRGRPDLRQSLALLAARGVSRLLVEAGARLAESFIAGELVDRLHIVDVAADIGRLGVPAALLGRFEDRIAAARFAEVDRRMLGEDKVRTFERS